MAGKYRTFVADPPWRYQNTASRGAAENHYPTMSIDELCALSVVPDNAADEALLFMWITSNHLPHGADIARAWGFDTITDTLTWVKTTKKGTVFMGLGNYFRMSTELVLVASRGGATLPDDHTPNSAFESLRRKHSQKPVEFPEMVMKLSAGPYMELFSRCDVARGIEGDVPCECTKCRFGWTVWGNQA